MKCPYRKIIYNVFEVIEGKYQKTEKKEEYADCYEKDCPYYNGNSEIFSYCDRVNNETEGKIR